MPSPTVIQIALDWTPNTLHSGLFLALTRGFYSSRNLSIHLIPPDESYTLTPAKLLSQNSADLALCPSESCIAYHESGKLRLQAIYAILGRDASAIAVTPALKKIADLGKAGKKYGSYNARYEDEIVKAMILHDGGEAGLEIVRDEGKLGMFDALKKGRVDGTWVFRPWEGIEEGAEKMNYFSPEESGVPYGYSPVIARDAGRGEEDGLTEDVLRRFVEATREGYECALRNPEKAVEVLYERCEPKRSREFLRKSQEMINGFYGDGRNKLGYMEREKWEKWVGWLRERGLLTGPREVKVEEIFDNRFAA